MTDASEAREQWLQQMSLIRRVERRLVSALSAAYRAALDRMLAEAREKALREAAEMCSSIRQRIANGPMPKGARFDYEQSILAMIDKP